MKTKGWTEKSPSSTTPSGAGEGTVCANDKWPIPCRRQERPPPSDSGPGSSLTGTLISKVDETPGRERVWNPERHCLELDGVRGVAILAVTIYRFCKELDPAAGPVLALIKSASGVGGRGVDLFFVLSGFLITGILLGTKAAKGYFRNFHARRILRIFPLYNGALVLCLWVLPTWFGSSAFDIPRGEQVYLWTYFSNVRMSWLNAWCFGPLDHFWSLAVEEHFYLVWPLVVFWLSSKALLRLSLGLVVGVGLIRVAASFRPEWSVAVEVLTIFRCDALVLGAIAAIYLQSLRGNEKVDRARRAAILALPVILLVAVGLTILGSGAVTLLYTVIPLGFAVALMVLVTGPRHGLLSRVMETPILRWFGRYSYGMYVVQLPLMTLLPLKLSEPLVFASLYPGLIGMSYVLVMLGMTSAIAWVSYHAFERHFLEIKKYF